MARTRVAPGVPQDPLCYDEKVPQDRSSRPIVLWRQVAIGLGLFGVYLAVDAWGVLDHAARSAAADAHGRAIFALEQSLHIDVEHALNNWLVPHPLLTTLANYEYAWTYIVSALLLLVWTWFRRPDLWRSTRDSFVVLNLVAMACFAFFPVTPPRMLLGLGFVDTVTHGGTVGSWGWGVVNAANQMAAMPSLHVGWALWVSVVLARITARRAVQAFSALHVVVTLLVVMATANHYLLDAVAVLIPVAIGETYVAWRYGAGSGGAVVPSCDAFFLHVEDTGAAQHVGGLVILEPADRQPTLEELRELVRGELAGLPRFRQRLAPGSRWRRPRWVEDPDLDLDWHVTERRSHDGMRGLHRIVADLAEEPMPRDRPLWRVLHVRDVAPDTSAMLFLAHHSISDGIGTILQSLHLFRPRVSLPAPDGTGPGPLQRAAAVGLGLAQLAMDGGAGRLPTGSLRRQFGVVEVDLDAVRRAASERGARVTDLVLALTADAVHATAPEAVAHLGGRLRCSVPLMVRTPDSSVEGNATAAVMVDVPVDGRPLDDLLADIGRRLRRPTRALASRFVMATGLRLLPEPLVGWFARTVYGPRFLHAVVSNMPGPTPQLTHLGVPLHRVYPILPVAPGAMLSLGAISWTGVLGIGLATDPVLLDVDRLARYLDASLASLTGQGPASDGGPEAVRPERSVRRPLQGEEQPSA
ncbi:MAG: phosphatase PAP2 family protein [Marmoricola sp.]